MAFLGSKTKQRIREVTGSKTKAVYNAIKARKGGKVICPKCRKFVRIEHAQVFYAIPLECGGTKEVGNCRIKHLPEYCERGKDVHEVHENKDRVAVPPQRNPVQESRPAGSHRPE